MDAIKNTATDTSLQLVFAWEIHPVLGNIIGPYAVNQLKSGHFSYEFYRLSGNTFNDYFPDADLAQREIMQVCENYSEDNLQRKFKPGKQKSRTFFQDIDPCFVADHIRPFIDRNIYKIGCLLQANDMPLYFKGEKNDRIKEKPLMVMPGLATVVFKFDRLKEHTTYSLQVFYDDQQLVLKDSGAGLISEKPCLLMSEDRIYRFDPEWEGKKLKPFFTKENLVIPVSTEKKYFNGFVLKAVKDYPVIASGFEILEDVKPPSGLLSLECNWLGKLAFQVYFKYADNVQFHAYDRAEKGKTLFNENSGNYQFIRIIRQWQAEREIISLLKMLGLVDKASEGFYLYESQNLQEDSGISEKNENMWQMIEWLGHHKPRLEENGIKLAQQTGDVKYFIGSPELILDVSEKTDWFDLHAVVVFGQHRIPFLRLRSFILEGNREFPLPDGTIGLIPPEWFERFHDIFRFATDSEANLALKKHHFPLLEQISEHGVKVPEISKTIEDFSSALPPANFKAVLRPYQLEGYQWLRFLHENKLGGCLADDMGLGKTIQTLALLSHIYNENQGLVDQQPMVGMEQPFQFDLFCSPGTTRLSEPLAASLLIMPLSLIHNWFQEALRFAPSLKVMQHTGPSRATSLRDFSGYHLVLTTYGTVRNDIEMLSQYNFKYIILDESQVIKNAESKIFNAIKSLKGEHRLVLTGTPIENSLSDLWSQFSFLNPGMLGSMNFFRKEYVLPVERSHDNVKRVKLQKLIEPFILRRTKTKVADDLPELTQVTRYCEMTHEHRSIYESRKSQIRNVLLEQVEREGLDKSRFLILSSLMKLRMLANHPVLSEEDYSFDSGKFMEVRSNLEKLLSEGHKVLIFSQFVKHLDVYRDYFDQEGYKYKMLTGKVPENERVALIEKFQNDPSDQLFLISIKAGGVGLNLTGADYVFILDPWWNPAVELQAINRAHRIGQKKKVFVYKFITRNTVEEKILLLQQKKSELAEMFIHSNNPLKHLDPENLKELME